MVLGADQFPRSQHGVRQDNTPMAQEDLPPRECLTFQTFAGSIEHDLLQRVVKSHSMRMSPYRYGVRSGIIIIDGGTFQLESSCLLVIQERSSDFILSAREIGKN